MREDVKACVEARTGFFGTYMTVPPALQPELDAFLAQITALGEEAAMRQNSSKHSRLPVFRTCLTVWYPAVPLRPTK